MIRGGAFDDVVVLSRRPFAAGQDVRRTIDGVAVHIIAVNMVQGVTRPYCIVDDPEHANQQWVAESDLERIT